MYNFNTFMRNIMLLAVMSLAGSSLVSAAGNTVAETPVKSTTYEVSATDSKIKMPPDAQAQIVDGQIKKADHIKNDINAKAEQTTVNKELAIKPKTATKAKPELFTCHGEIRFEAIKKNYGQYDLSMNRTLLRLEPRLNINKHWMVKARIDRWFDLDEGFGASAYAENNFQLKRLWLETRYGNFIGKAGKIGYTDLVTGGLLFDGQYAGVELGYDVKKRFHFDVGGGYPAESDYVYPVVRNVNGKNVIVSFDAEDTKFIKSELCYSSKKFSAGIGYYLVSKVGRNLTILPSTNSRIIMDDIHIWSVGASYRFDPNITICAAYDVNDAHMSSNASPLNSAVNKSYRIMTLYKRADYKKPGSYGFDLGYQHIGMSAVQSTWGALITGSKGWFLGGSVVLCKNVAMTMEYFDGKAIDDSYKTNMLYGKLSIVF